MTREEKAKILTKIWEKQIKGNKTTIFSWSRNPKSFIKWSWRKYREGYKLTKINKLIGMVPYNLEYSKPIRRNKSEK